MNRHVLCFVGNRQLNKRTSLFIEGFAAGGFAVRVASLPRGQWNLSRFESCSLVPERRRFSIFIGNQKVSKITAVCCFHWIMLPIATLMSLFARVPLIYDEHDHYEMNTLEGKGASWVKRTRWMLCIAIHRCCVPFCSLVTCIHMHESLLKQRLEKLNKNVLELHNYPVRTWRQPKQKPEGQLEFLYVGGIYEEKGICVIANAFSMMLANTQIKAKLHVFGTGDQSIVGQLQSNGDIQLHGNRSPEEIRRFISVTQCCGLVIFPNHPRYNLVGTNTRKLFEYLAASMPVIVTDSGEIGNTVRQASLGFVVPKDVTSEALASVMELLARDPSRACQLSGNAYLYMTVEDRCWESEWKKALAAFGDLKLFSSVDADSRVSPENSPPLAVGNP